LEEERGFVGGVCRFEWVGGGSVAELWNCKVRLRCSIQNYFTTLDPLHVRKLT